MLKNNTNITRTLLVTVLIVCYSMNFSAQQIVDPNPLTVNQALEQENIARQFDYVIEKSNRFQDFKVVKRVFLEKLKKNALDSLKIYETKITSTNAALEKQKKSVANLEKSLAESNQKLDAVTLEKDNMNFLGMAFTKSSYKSLMWSISGVLLVLLLFFIYKFKNSNAITIAAKKALSETEGEFEDHRRKALEREQKLNRKLQDEINKQRNKTV